MQDAAALLVAHCVEHIFRRGVVETHQVLGFAAAVEVTLHALEVFRIAGVLAVFVFVPEGLGVVGKGFFERQVAPVFCRHIISEPLVEEFVCDRAFPVVAVHQFAGVLLGAFLVDRGGGVLHRAGSVITSYQLSVFHPGVVHARDAGEIGHHFRRVAEDFAGYGTVFFFHVVAHFLAAPAVLDHGIIAHAHEEQVGGMGLVHLPVVGARSIGIIFLAHQFTVAEGDVFGRHRHINFLGGFLVGFVDCGKPDRVGFRFALCPDLDGFFLVFAAGIDKIQSLCAEEFIAYFFRILIGFGRVLDIHRVFFAPLVRFIEAQVHRQAVVLVGQGHHAAAFLHGCFVDFHAFGIQ